MSNLIIKDILSKIDSIKQYDDYNLPFHTDGAKYFMNELEQTFKNAPEYLKNDKNLALKLIDVDLNCVKYLSDELKNNEEVRRAVFMKFLEYRTCERLGLQELEDVENLDIKHINSFMKEIYEICDEVDFKEEERYPQRTLIKTKDEDYNLNNGGFPPPPGNSQVLINPSYVKVQDRKAKDFEIDDGIIREPGKVKDIGILFNENYNENPFLKAHNAFYSDMSLDQKKSIYNETLNFLETINYEQVYGYDLESLKLMKTEYLGDFLSSRYMDVEAEGVTNFYHSLECNNNLSFDK